MMKNDVFNARIKTKRRMQKYSYVNMTKKGVKITDRSETVEREVKMGRVKPLPGVSRTRVKAHVRKQDLGYASPSPRTQSLKNRAMYP